MSSPYSRAQELSGHNRADTPREDDGRKRFISSHSDTFNPCDFPHYDKIHGYLSSRTANLGGLVPVFALSKSSLNSDILGVPLEDWMNQTFPGVDWDKKTSSKLVWRGSTTGGYWRGADGINSFRKSQRARLVNFTHAMAEAPGNSVPVLSRDLTLANVSTELLDGMLDLAFSGKPTCKQHRFIANSKVHPPDRKLAKQAMERVRRSARGTNSARHLVIWNRQSTNISWMCEYLAFGE